MPTVSRLTSELLHYRTISRRLARELQVYINARCKLGHVTHSVLLRSEATLDHFTEFERTHRRPK